MEKKKILIVEDESIVALDLKSVLDRLGYDVIASVTSGKEAIKVSASLKPDSILMDIGLGDDMMDGVEAAKQIKKKLPFQNSNSHSNRPPRRIS